MSDKLAIFGGSKVIGEFPQALFHWPIVTDEDIAAVTAVLRAGTMSGQNITREFEAAYAAWNGTRYALGTCNGTAALAACFWACGVGAGDEVICPSATYWASCAGAVQLGAQVVFADIDPETLCLSPAEVEKRITSRTKAVLVVNYAAMPAALDEIIAIAHRHGALVIEDNSHAQGSMYDAQRMCGAVGDIAAASLMSGKSFAIGEAGIITTDNFALYERCVAYGHYERTGGPSRFGIANTEIKSPDLLHFKGLPMGGVKHRMVQTCAAMGLVQIKHQNERIAVIDQAMNYFADRVDALGFLRVVRPVKESGMSKGGWYFPLCHYQSEKLQGVPAARFAEALSAEGVTCGAGANFPLHLHRYFHDLDFFHQGSPTVLAFGQPDRRQGEGSLPVSESLKETVIQIPWFKHFDRELIDRQVEAYAKVAAQASTLL